MNDVNDDSVTREALAKLARTLENDLDALGWDQPHRMYVVAGSLEDPRLELTIELPIQFHPCDLLQHLYDSGHRLREGALGLAFATEGWRHLTYPELREGHPNMTAAVEGLTDTLFPDLTGDERERILTKSLLEMQSGLRPSQAPDHLRKETRSITTVLRNGQTIAVSRTRGKDDHDVFYDKGRVAHFMHQYLRGERPQDSEEESSHVVPPTGQVD